MKTTDNSANTNSTAMPIRASAPHPEFGELQRFVDKLYERNPSQTRTKIEILTRAQIDDLGPELTEVIELLPGGSYKRYRLCDQLNSIITAHGWGYLFGTVE